MSGARARLLRRTNDAGITGLPLSGLICAHFPAKQYYVGITDQAINDVVTGAYPLYRGSNTTAADANDPTWTTTGLSFAMPNWAVGPVPLTDWGTRNFTAFVVGKFNNASDSRPAWNLSVDNNNRFTVYTHTTTAGALDIGCLSGGSFVGGSPMSLVVPTTAGVVLGLRRLGTALTLMRMDTRASVTATITDGPLGSAYTLSFGALSDGASPVGVQTVTADYLYNRYLPDTEFYRAGRVLMARCLPFFDALVAVDGDSIMAEMVANLLGVWPSYWDVRDFTVGGQTIAQMSSDAAATIDPLIASETKINKVCVFHEYGGLAADQAAWVAYGQARQAAGWKVVVVTSGSNATENNDWWAWNAWLRANYVTFGNALADVEGVLHVGNPGDYANTTYFNVDGVHYTAAGCAILAGVIKTAIESLL